MRLLVVFTLLLVSLTVDVFAQETKLIYRVRPDNANEQFGKILQKTDLNNDGFQDIFISAPEFSQGLDTLSRGRIYLLKGPLLERNSVKDTILYENSVLFEGHKNLARIGETMVLGDFNGDGLKDIAYSLSKDARDDNRTQIAIHFGPISQENRLLSDQANLYITAQNPDDGFGTTLRTISSIDGSSRDGLIIGANRFSTTSTNLGRVYIFKNLNRNGSISASEAQIIITGSEEFAQLGVSAASLGDIDGDGISEVAVGAHLATGSAFRSGNVYIFGLDLANGNYTAASAKILMKGTGSQLRWGTRIHALGDIDGDNLTDFAVVSLELDNGRVLLYHGRNNWPDTLQLNVSADENDAFQSFGSGNQPGTGYNMLFKGDFNLDGITDPIITSNLAGGRRGLARFYKLSDSRIIRNVGGGTSSGARFGEQILNISNISQNDPYGIDDIAIGAPFEGSVANGFVYIYAGLITPPQVTLSVSPSSNGEIGDTLGLIYSVSQGSRSIRQVGLVSNFRSSSADTTFLNPNAEYPQEQAIIGEFDSNIRYGLYAIDDLEIEAFREITLRFAAKPVEFDLVTNFTEVLDISGDRNQTLEFGSAASADTNGRAIQYQLYLSLNEDDFGVDTETSPTLIRTQNSSVFEMTFDQFKNFLVANLVEINRQRSVYWSVAATNGVLSRFASNGPRQISLVRQELDPSFEITSGDMDLILNGLPTETFTFEWSQLITDAASPIVQYRFQIYNNVENIEFPIFSKFSADDGLRRTYSLPYDTLYSILVNNSLLEVATTDTARLYYSVQAVINGLDTWMADNGPLKASAKYVQIIRPGISETPSDLPTQLKILGNYPNPFNPTTTLRFGLPETDEINVEVYNILGQRVLQVATQKVFSAGWHSLEINASQLSSGTYLYVIYSQKNRATGRFLLLK